MRSFNLTFSWHLAKLEKYFAGYLFIHVTKFINSSKRCFQRQLSKTSLTFAENGNEKNSKVRKYFEVWTIAMKIGTCLILLDIHKQDKANNLK